jgi:hypothetical protein
MMIRSGMMISRRCFVGAAFALATLVAVGGVIGCGGGGSSRSDDAVMAKADVVDVTYYYLPG